MVLRMKNLGGVFDGGWCPNAHYGMSPTLKLEYVKVWTTSHPYLTWYFRKKLKSTPGL